MPPTRTENCLSASGGIALFLVLAVGFFLLLTGQEPRRHGSDEGDLTSKAEERFTTQPLNHYAKDLKDTFQQRYFYVQPPRKESKIIFLYAGNEASVESYVNSCGLMWENAEPFNAALVFAEHRFWGKSVPKHSKQFEFAGPNQAIEDYIALVRDLVKNESKAFVQEERVKVVVLGGSYGGMLAAWMRLLRPDVIDAAVASSAPILAFPDPRIPGRNTNFYKDGGASYYKVVTKVFAKCAPGIHAALASAKLTSPASKQALGICDDKANSLRTEADVLTWIAYVLETLCMADYSFPSTYITGRILPARPAKLSCDRFLEKSGGLEGIRAAIGVMLNDTGTVKCHHVPDRRDASFYDGLWDQYFCRWLIPQETYFAMQGPPNDMFLKLPVDWMGIDKHCNDTLGVFPDGGSSVARWFRYALTERDWARKASRIVFANGGHDPWSSGGYYSTSNKELVPIWIPSGAHHAELMFSSDDDPDDIRRARKRTMQWVSRWLESSQPSMLLPNIVEEDVLQSSD